MEAIDKPHNSVIPIRNIGLVEEWSDYDFIATRTDDGVLFRHTDLSGASIEKHFKVIRDGEIDLKITLTGYNTKSYNLFVGYFDPSEVNNPLSQRYYETCSFVNGAVSRKAIQKVKNIMPVDGEIAWQALRDRYFCSMIIPQHPVNKGVIKKLVKGYVSYLEIEPSAADKFVLYLGPQDGKRLKSLGNGAENLIYFGVFNSISKILLSLINVLHKVTRNWGVSIILISALIYLVFYPITFKSMLSMRRMQGLQPKIEEIKQKHKDNPQKLNVEIMELYRREKVNPLGGCLPMLLQIPVFFALYQLLMRLINLKCASFLWVKDLSEPDRAIVFANKIPLLGNELNILPLLMAGLMFFQQKMTMPKMGHGSQAAEQQKIMAIMMPVLFGVLFYKMPSGLVLYWLTNSLFMFVFQWKISKITQ
ncbi:MAG: YidC/Oxa1 family insertase periplasmic-domain containing protein [Candidatus Omnitrophota bacterium]